MKREMTELIWNNLSMQCKNKVDANASVLREQVQDKHAKNKVQQNFLKFTAQKKRNLGLLIQVIQTWQIIK